MNDLVRTLKDCMSSQLEILNNFSENEKLLKTNVENHNWEGLNRVIREMHPLSEKIDDLDIKRSKAFKALCSYFKEPDNASFYQVAVHFSIPDRELCTELYQQLKIAVIRIQSITWSIDNYVRTVSGTIHQILDNVFPHRKGNIYSNTGSVREFSGIDPVLINQQL